VSPTRTWAITSTVCTRARKGFPISHRYGFFGFHPIIEMQIGPARFTVDPKSQAARRPFEHRLIVRETGFRLPPGRRAPSVQELYAALAADEKRNGMVLNDAIACLDQRRSPILQTERRDQLEYSAEKLRKFTRHLVVLHGGMRARARRAVAEHLGAIPSDEERLVLATGRYIGEGFERHLGVSWP
jgi:hypothetical protein